MDGERKERASFVDRASFDCVFALALVHHLLIASRLPLEAIRDMLADLTSAYLVMEYVGPGDAMFDSFLGARENLYSDLTVEHFLCVFGRRFELIERTPVADHRVLVSFRKRSSVGPSCALEVPVRALSAKKQ